MNFEKNDLVYSIISKMFGTVNTVEDEKIWVDYEGGGYPSDEKAENLTIVIKNFGPATEIKNRLIEIIAAQQEMINALKNNIDSLKSNIES